MSNTLARLTDSLTAPASEGYVAERHPLLPSLVLVWAPCGCVWTLALEENFVTACDQRACVFNWNAASEALEALQTSEKAHKIATGPGLVVAPPKAQVLEATSSPISDMISEGGPVAGAS